MIVRKLVILRLFGVFMKKLCDVGLRMFLFGLFWVIVVML